MVITVDTNGLIWGVKKVATKGQEHMIERMSRFLQWTQDRGDRINLTSHVVAEYVGAFPPDVRAAQFQAIRRYFPVHPFDLRAAEIAADLLCDEQRIKDLRDEFGVSRQCLKADIAIVATAAASGIITTIYSNDLKVRKLSQGLIIPKDIPELSEMTAEALPDPRGSTEVRRLFEAENDDE